MLKTLREPREGMKMVEGMGPDLLRGIPAEALQHDLCRFRSVGDRGRKRRRGGGGSTSQFCVITVDTAGTTEVSYEK